MLVVVLIVGLCLGAAPLGWGFTADPEKDLPNLDRLEIFQPGEPSILYASGGEPFASLAQEFRIFVPLSRVPQLVRRAVLDIEDAQFYEHGAISLKGMARAALRNLTAAKVKEGGSTITQQLAKGLFLTPERTLARKVKEIQLATEIEHRYSKDKILEMYLNTIYFGGGAYGIEAAARTYFSKSVGQLTLGEAALLAGLAQGAQPVFPVYRHQARQGAAGHRAGPDADAGARHGGAGACRPERAGDPEPLLQGARTGQLFRGFRAEGSGAALRPGTP